MRKQTQQQLTLSGVRKQNAAYYDKLNWQTGTVIPKDTTIKPPRQYQKETKNAWKAMTANLIQMGALSMQDLPELGIMFDAYDRYVIAKQNLERYDTAENADWLNPEWLKGRYTLHRMMQAESASFDKLCSKFGCTPTERLKLNCEKEDKKKEEDPLEVALGGM